MNNRNPFRNRFRFDSPLPVPDEIVWSSQKVEELVIEQRIAEKVWPTLRAWNMHERTLKLRALMDFARFEGQSKQ